MAAMADELVTGWLMMALMDPELDDDSETAAL